MAEASSVTTKPFWKASILASLLSVNGVCTMGFTAATASTLVSSLTTPPTRKFHGDADAAPAKSFVVVATSLSVLSTKSCMLAMPSDQEIFGNAGLLASTTSNSSFDSVVKRSLASGFNAITLDNPLRVKTEEFLSPPAPDFFPFFCFLLSLFVSFLAFGNGDSRLEATAVAIFRFLLGVEIEVKLKSCFFSPIASCFSLELAAPTVPFLTETVDSRSDIRLSGPVANIATSTEWRHFGTG